MPRGPSKFRQNDLTRAVRAVRAGGIEVGRVEVDPTTGKIVIETNCFNKGKVSDLEKWIATHASSA